MKSNFIRFILKCIYLGRKKKDKYFKLLHFIWFKPSAWTTFSQNKQSSAEAEKKASQKSRSCSEKVTQPGLTEAAVMASECLFWLQQRIFVWLIWTFAITTSSWSTLLTVLCHQLWVSRRRNNKTCGCFWESVNIEMKWLPSLSTRNLLQLKEGKEGTERKRCAEKGSSICMISGTISGLLLGDRLHCRID